MKNNIFNFLIKLIKLMKKYNKINNLLKLYNKEKQQIKNNLKNKKISIFPYKYNYKKKLVKQNFLMIK